MKQAIKDTISSFRDEFYQLVRQIPAGRVTTYGSLAEALGDKRAARAVGRMLSQNPDLVTTPCHRVVKSNGELGGYVEGKKRKRELLQAEGIGVKANKIDSFSNRLFTDFTSQRPLNRLRQEQQRAKGKLKLEKKEEEVEVIGGIDASYSQERSDNTSYAALYLEDKEGRLDQREKIVTTKAKVNFPYIPTYLAFRELPLFLEVLDLAEVEEGLRPDMVLVDGNGYLHPEKFGLACHLGVETELSTIGASKSLLCGQLEEEITEDRRQSVVRDSSGQRLGHALLSSDRAKNPIYVSPGHLTNFDQSLQVVKNNCEYKIPRPIRQAHLAANKLRLDAKNRDD